MPKGALLACATLGLGRACLNRYMIQGRVHSMKFAIAAYVVLSGLAIGLLILGFARPAPATA